MVAVASTAESGPQVLSARRTAMQADGARLAVKKFNAANPDCKVTMEEFDTEGDPTKATPVATKLAADTSFLGVIGGHFSGESRATAPTFESAGLAMVAP